MELKTGMEPLIRKTEDVCGGDACIANTRIMVWIVELHRRWGHTVADVLEDYPHLSEVEIEAAWRYAAEHPDEIDEAIRDNQDG